MSYFESRLRLNFKDFIDIKKKVQLSEKLGIMNLILEPIDIKEKINQDLKERIINETNIKIHFRVNLKIKSLKEYKTYLNKFNNFPDIFSIETLNKDIQLQAAKDSRVDIISFSNIDILKSLSPGVISLTKQNNSFIEFSLAPIMTRNKAFQSKNFRILFRSLQLAKKMKANYIISGNFNNYFDLRHPRALISICNSLLGLSLIEAKTAFRENPKKILLRVKDRMNESIIESGVKLIKGGV